MGFGFALITAFGVVLLMEMKQLHGSPTLPCPAEYDSCSVIYILMLHLD